MDGLKMTIFGEVDPPVVDANVDVEIQEEDGTRWSASFFTVENVDALFAKNAVTGECARGTYLWASDMIIVQILSRETIETAIRDLRASGRFTAAFARLEEI